MKTYLRARHLPAYVLLLALVTGGILWWGGQKFYFPSLRSGVIITVPLAVVLSLSPALIWALIYDVSRFVLTRTSLRVRALAFGDWLIALIPALSVALILALLLDHAAARNIVFFLAITLFGQAISDRYYVFFAPTLYLLCCLALGWPFGEMHPEWWAFAIDDWDPRRDAILCLSALTIASFAFLARRLRG